MASLINLPWFITAHALGLCTLGLYLTFSSTSQPPPPSRRSNTSSSALGIATLGLGLAYLSTSYMPMERNQFLYATIPVRIILAGVAGVRVALDGKEGGLGNGEKRKLLSILVYDGLGGVYLGFWLGVWTGRVPKFE